MSKGAPVTREGLANGGRGAGRNGGGGVVVEGQELGVGSEANDW